MRACRRAARRASRPRRPSRDRFSPTSPTGGATNSPMRATTSSRVGRAALTCASSACAHGGEMAGEVPQQPPMMRAPASTREADIVGHQLGRAGIVDLVADEIGHAAIALGDDDRLGPRRGHVEERREEVGGADAAIGADGERRSARAVGEPWRSAGARPIMVRPAVSKLAV